MNTAIFLLASLLPVIPQPTEWKPGEGECDIRKSRVVTTLVKDKSLGDEGYRMKIEPGAPGESGRVTIEAPTEVGIVWGRQTLAQLKTAGGNISAGEIVDSPKYRVRGFVMDVGRMYHSLDFLYDLARTMSYFKMNTLHVHLNDNEICKDPKADWSTKQAAFRLESETYPELTAKDGHYTKAEFRRFVKDCAAMGVTVVPEIDVPAHSLAFTRVRPDFASKKYGADHFDLDKTDEILAWLKPLFAEYLTGDDPVFATPYCHVGTDEYNKAEAEKFRRFTDEMLKMVEGFGYKACAWGALTHAKGEYPVKASKDITIDIWHNPYYQPKEAIAAGYSVVCVPDGLVYLVPFAGYYYDYLNHRYLFDNWEADNIAGYQVPPENLDQVAGGKFALWNDALGKKKDGTPYTEADNWDRIFPALETSAEKLWTGKRADVDWNFFSTLGNSLGEPAGVKMTHAYRFK